MQKQNGKIIDFIGGLATIIIENNVIIKAKPIGKFKYKNKITPMVGDNVVLNWNTDSYQIVDILQRKNSLIRPKVANIDYVIIIQSIIEPKLNLSFLNKMILFYEAYIENVVIAFSKADLLSNQDDNELNHIINEYRESGYNTYNINDVNDFNNLLSLFSDNVVLLVGNSGVGKSTFINKINPELKLKVQEISKALNRGKHTTTNNKIIKFEDYMIVDSPGFSSVELSFSKQQIGRIWHDFKEHSTKCKFQNCLHINEPGCEIVRLVNENKIKKFRYDDYISFLKNKK